MSKNVIFKDNEENLKDKMRNKKNRKWKIILFIGLLPFIIVLSIGVFSVFSGFTFFLSTSYGLEAFLGSIFILSFLFWPIYIIGVILIILSIIKIKQNK